MKENQTENDLENEMDTLGPFKGINKSIIPIINGQMEHKLKLVSISIGSRFRKTRGPFFGCLMIRIDILILRSLACVPPVSGKSVQYVGYRLAI